MLFPHGQDLFKKQGMVTAKIKTFNTGLIIPGFLVILTSIAFGSFLHAFLHPELHPYRDNHLLIGAITAVLFSILIVIFFLHTRQLTTKLKARELLRAKEEWEKTFNTMTDFVSVHDKDFKIIKANRALCEFHGKSSEEILGKFCYRIFHNMDEPFINCPHQKASEIDHPVTEIILDPKIGVPLQITCSPLFNEDGTFQGSVHIARVHEGGTQTKKVEEIVPICAACKSIRKNDDMWITPENYFIKKYDILFTHTLCRDCRDKLYPDFMNSPRAGDNEG
ncbi:MAG: PAS domain-containing protein [Desulfobulbaceae bacterium]|nr:PAS domain-containing protein [Desulfobulbaceae bacterium]